jgi:hypothetical protein
VSEVNRNAGEIERYLEVLLPKLEPRGGIPENPMNRKERGESRPPVSPYVMSLWMANPHAGRINEVLEQAARSSEEVELEGRAMWEILGECLFDHTAIRRWKAEGGAPERRFWMLCRLLAQRLAIKHGRPGKPYILTVYIHPEDEQQRQATREAQKRDTAHTDRVIVRRVESLETEGLGREEAKRALTSDPENTWSYWRIDRAIVDENRRSREGAA